jgi:acetolactate synthase II small subunit
MKQHQLSLITGSRPEVVERILRVVRHRGYALRQLNMESLPNSSSLQSQLDKLIDVFQVETHDHIEQSAIKISA